METAGSDFERYVIEEHVEGRVAGVAPHPNDLALPAVEVGSEEGLANPYPLAYLPSSDLTLFLASNALTRAGIPASLGRTYGKPYALWSLGHIHQRCRIHPSRMECRE